MNSNVLTCILPQRRLDSNRLFAEVDDHLCTADGCVSLAETSEAAYCDKPAMSKCLLSVCVTHPFNMIRRSRTKCANTVHGSRFSLLRHAYDSSVVSSANIISIALQLLDRSNF